MLTLKVTNQHYKDMALTLMQLMNLEICHMKKVYYLLIAMLHIQVVILINTERWNMIAVMQENYVLY